MKAMMRKGKLPPKKINFVAMGGDGATADIGMGRSPAPWSAATT